VDRPGDPMNYRVCPRCGWGRFGPCPACDGPEVVVRAQRQQNAMDDARIADEERRRQGMRWCWEHDRHDGCVQPVPHISQETARALIPAEETRSRGLSWFDAYMQLVDRYAPPDA